MLAAAPLEHRLPLLYLRHCMSATLVFDDRAIGWAEFHAELPREESGKIFKRRLREPYWSKAGRRI